MITKLSISLTWVDSTSHHPNLPAGVHSMSEIMPLVLAAHGLAMQDDDTGQPTVPSITTDFELMIAVLESALESALAS